MSAPPPNAVAITGRGMVSSLGTDVVSACAAARAGLVSPVALDFEVRNREGDIEPATGHPVRDLTKGFEGFGRLVRLAQLGLADLAVQVPTAPWRTRDIGFYLSFPDPLREHAGIELAHPDERETRERDAADAREETDSIQDTAEELLRTAALAAGWPVEPHLRFAAGSGHTGVAQALARALSDMAKGAASAAIVGGIDSLLDDAALGWLSGLQRLKTPAAAAGLIPGEAAAFLLLEAVHTANSHGRAPIAVLRHVEIATEPRAFLTGQSPLGQGLSDALARAVAPGPFFLVSDHTGEDYRALDWGHALSRLRARAPWFEPQATWYTCASFGDTGAASGAVGLCLATSAFLRSYAPAPAAIVTSADDGPLRAATLVGHA
jgi:3-oxoacyl-[acyl-carrier-protein] synthase-1